MNVPVWGTVAPRSSSSSPAVVADRRRELGGPRAARLAQHAAREVVQHRRGIAEQLEDPAIGGELDHAGVLERPARAQRRAVGAVRDHRPGLDAGAPGAGHRAAGPSERAADREQPGPAERAARHAAAVGDRGRARDDVHRPAHDPRPREQVRAVAERERAGVEADQARRAGGPERAGRLAAAAAVVELQHAAGGRRLDAAVVLDRRVDPAVAARRLADEAGGQVAQQRRAAAAQAPVGGGEQHRPAVLERARVPQRRAVRHQR